MPDTLSLDEVRRVARLARLALTDDDARRFAAQIADVLRHVAAMQSVDTTGVPVTPQPGAVSALRDDRCEPSLAREDALAAAPDADGAAGLFKVPRVLG